MDVHLKTRTAVFTLSLAIAVPITDLTEKERRYHIGTHGHFEAELAYGRATFSAYSTGRSVWVTPPTAMLTFTGYAPVVAISTSAVASV